MPEMVWRLRLAVLSAPPAGWIEKGNLLYDGFRLTYLPDGATKGLRDAQVRGALEPVFELCR